MFDSTRAGEQMDTGSSGDRLEHVFTGRIEVSVDGSERSHRRLWVRCASRSVLMSCEVYRTKNLPDLESTERFKK